MASFTLDGTTHEYLRQNPGPHENIKSWEYGQYPKVMATVPLTTGTVDAYAHASRWDVPCGTVNEDSLVPRSRYSRDL